MSDQAGARRLVVFFNPGSGLETITSGFLAEALDQAGARYELVELTRDLDLDEEVARLDPEAGAVLVAAGGDGTVAAVANVAVRGPRPFGVLPLGTRNHFAKDAGVPLELGDAVEALLEGQPRPVDTGEVEGRIFVNNASLGLYPRFVEERRRQSRSVSRWLAIAGSAWWVLRRRHHIDVRVGGDPHALRASVVFIGNNRYELEGTSMGRRSRVDEGVLLLSIATARGAGPVLQLAANALLGRLERDRDYEERTAREIELQVRRRRVRVALDGETVRMRPPLRFRIRPGSLALLLPRERESGPAD